MKNLSTTLIAGVLLATAIVTASANPERWKREGWDKTDFAVTSINLGEVMSGGIGRDVIPPIDKPAFKPLAEVKNVADTEPVIGLDVGEAAIALIRLVYANGVSEEMDDLLFE